MQNKSYNVDVFSISSVQVWVGNILIRTHMPADLAEKNWTGPFLELTDKAVWKLLPEKKVCTVSSFDRKQIFVFSSPWFAVDLK